MTGKQTKAGFINDGARPNRFRTAWVWAFLPAILYASAPALAADLTPETIQSWKEYIQSVKARNQQHLVPGTPFLSSDAIPGQAARLRAGEIIVTPADPHVPLKVPCGLIHDWTGAVFIPNVSLPDVLSFVRDYRRYPDIYHPNVVESRLTGSSALEDRFSMLLMNKSLIAKTALDGDYRSSFTRLDDQHWYDTSETTRIREIADYGTSSQHPLPEDEGRGLIWRLYSVSRFEERDGGVYIEIEAVALSRDIPVALRWVVEPIVRRISRSSLMTSLQQTQAGVLSEATTVSAADRRQPAPAPTSAGVAHSFR